MKNTISDLSKELDIGNPKGVFQFTTLGQFLGSIISLVITIAAIASFIVFIYSGIMFITAGDNKENLQSAKDRMVNAIVGMGLTVSAYIIWRIAIRFFGLESVFPEG